MADMQIDEIAPRGGARRYTPRRKAGDGAGQAHDPRLRKRARGLGWFSVGLGVAQLWATRRMARTIGIADDTGASATLRAVGLRELTAGVGLLRYRRPARWLWARVVGDVMDLAMLGWSWRRKDASRARLGLSMAAVAGVTALDAWTARQASRPGPQEMTTITRAITINRPPEDVYRFWRELTNLPRFMANLELVQVRDPRHSHWKALGPAGTTIEWDAEITEERANELIAWRWVGKADVPNTGRVYFRPAPGGRGTEVRVELSYLPPAGKLGTAVAKIFGKDPSQQVSGDLRRLKQVLETGGVVHSDASIHRGKHPARPDWHRQPMVKGGAR